jgi:hypothetical protein
MKRKIFILLFITIIFSVSIVAQEEQNWPSKTYEMGDFTRIKLDGGFKVYLIQGDECIVTVKSN